MNFPKHIVSLAVATTISALALAQVPTDDHQPTAKPWMNIALSADRRADLVLKEMTQDEKFKLILGYFGSDTSWKHMTKIPAALPHSAGYVEGVPRLGIPALFETDAGVGVASQATDTPRERTALPSGLATAATWNRDLAYQGGAMIGSEARSSGFNVMLAGGINLLRDPRNGRNFEYAGEDPLLAGTMVAQQIKGIQSNHVISTLKHFAFNDQETGREVLDARIDDIDARLSDLLAMQLAVEQADPGSVMCAYNRVNAVYACENAYLLNEVLKKDWGFKGYVMSDWGGVHSAVAAANHGLDQESGSEFDDVPYFSDALKQAVQAGEVPQTRIDDMVRRVLRTLFDKGVADHPVAEGGIIDFNAHAEVTRSDAEESIVLLKNVKQLLPLGSNLRRIAVIGSHADVGVLSGGGSSQVYPVGGNAVKGLKPQTWPGPVVYYPSSPLTAIRAQAPNAQVSYDAGTDVLKAAALAAQADVVVLFASQWIGENNDAQSLALPDNQDALIAAVAGANPNTIVILETGGPIAMPWLDQVGAVLEAWYPGTSGGKAIGRALFGEVNPSGHLPSTFPASESQLPRPTLDGDRNNQRVPLAVTYHEGAAVGYKWFDMKGLTPLFPFGYGLSYTQFSYSGLTSKLKNGNLHVRFKVTNVGKVKGKDVPQVYLSPIHGKWEAPKRLGTWDKVELNPGESREVDLTVDSRFLGMIDGASKSWWIAEGDYKIILAHNANDANSTSVTVHLHARTLSMNGEDAK